MKDLFYPTLDVALIELVLSSCLKLLEIIILEYNQLSLPNSSPFSGENLFLFFSAANFPMNDQLCPQISSIYFQSTQLGLIF